MDNFSHLTTRRGEIATSNYKGGKDTWNIIFQQTKSK